MALTPTARAVLYLASGASGFGKEGPNDSDRACDSDRLVNVQFNPTTLSYSVNNTLQPKSRDNPVQQFVAQTTAKLELELVFDMTHSGADVREKTRLIRRFLDAGAAGSEKPAPPEVGFLWGTFKFKGIVESFRETLDFFSDDGVPLRSSVKLTLSSSDRAAVFTDDTGSSKKQSDVVMTGVPASGTSGLGAQGGDTRAGRNVAAQNGFESMRNPGARMAAVAGGGVELKAAAGFSAGAGIGGGVGIGGGIGAGAGIGGGVSAGAGIGIGAAGGVGASFGAAAGIGAGASFGAAAGGGASAGVSAGAAAQAGGGSFGFGTSAQSSGVPSTQGAFAGLSASKTKAVARLDVTAFEARPAAPAQSSGFARGGRALTQASTGLVTDVGLNARIRFD